MLKVYRITKGESNRRLARDYLRSEAAHAVGISRSAVTQRMARLKGDWEEFQPDPLH